MAEQRSKKSRAATLIEQVRAPEVCPTGDEIGLGVDLVDIARIKTILARTPRFASRVYTEKEQAYCNEKATPETHYATRFAAKEAVLKALGVGFAKGVDPRDVETLRSSKGRPYVVLHGRAKEIAQEQGVIDVPISLSYTHTQAVAIAMAITKGALAQPEKTDPRIELSKQFKELRGMLDTLGSQTALELADSFDDETDASAQSSNAEYEA